MSQAYQTIDVSLRDGLLHICLNDPAKRNALSRQMRLELIEVLENPPNCKAMILRAEGNVFCAGGDISAMGQSLEASLEGLGYLHEISRLLAHFSRPVIAAVQGGAYGAGFSLALLADAIVATPEAKFAASFGKMGLAPDTAFLWSIQRRLSVQKALQLIATARVVAAEEALALGLIDEVNGDLLARAEALANDYAAVAPLTLAKSKAWLAQTSDLEGHLRQEFETQKEMYLSLDHREAVAAFREKRLAVFEGK